MCKRATYKAAVMEKMLNADEEKKAITAAEYVARRNAYAYPAVGLGGCLITLAQRTFLSIRSMENHHRFLLRSQDDESAVLGYLSVIYWGHYSGQDGIPRGARDVFIGELERPCGHSLVVRSGPLRLHDA